MDFSQNSSVPIDDSRMSDGRKFIDAQVVSEQGKEAAKDIIFGSAAGIVGKFIEYPFDTVKVRLQSQPDGLPIQYKGPLDCFRQSWRADGIQGLYRGISAPLVGAAVETSSLFFSVSLHLPLLRPNSKLTPRRQYRLAQRALQATILPQSEPLPFSVLVACGAISGAFTSVALTPIELVKCKMQVPFTHFSGRPQGALAIIASIWRHQGLLGFWHGQLGTLIRETGGSAAWFGSYEAVSLFFRRAYRRGAKDTLPVWQQMTAGAVAGMTYNFIFYPADTIKSRMQTEDVTKITGGKRTFWAVGRALWNERGLSGFYRGCGLTVGRAAPSSAFIFAVYEALRRNFG